MKTIALFGIAVCLLMPCRSQGQARSFTDVPYRSWPYAAYKRLVKIGFAHAIAVHSEYSKNPTLTRYEFAVATDLLVKHLAAKEPKLSAHDHATTVQLVHKLAREFQPEINSLHR